MDTDTVVRAARIAGCLAAPLVVLAAPVVVLAVPAALGLAYLYVSSQIIPAKSAEVSFPELDVTVKLQFYFTWGDNDSGRYISVTNRSGTIRGKIDGWDWAHNARTSIYATPEGNVAILGPAQSDYIADNKTLQLKYLWSAGNSSETWKYMGAFDLGKPSLHFFRVSDQKECIPMLMEYEPDPSLPRSRYRRASCDRTTSP
jgi:hypothetical protein